GLSSCLKPLAHGETCMFTSEFNLDMPNEAAFCVGLRQRVPAECSNQPITHTGVTDGGPGSINNCPPGLPANAPAHPFCTPMTCAVDNPVASPPPPSPSPSPSPQTCCLCSYQDFPSCRSRDANTCGGDTDCYWSDS